MKKEITFNFSDIPAMDKANALTSSKLLQQASLLSEYNLEGLKNITGNTVPWTEEEESLLKKYSVIIKKDGTYSVRDYERNLVLKSLGAVGIRNGMAAISIPANDHVQVMFDKYINEEAPAIDQQNLQELVATYSVSRWLKDTGIPTPDENEILVRIRQEESLKPFKQLTQNFKGRNTELAKLSDYVDWRPKSTILGSVKGWVRDIIRIYDKPLLIITGIGGVGKSTLVSKFILDQLNYKGKKKLPFIYFDFDKPGLSVSNPIELAIEALRQLSIQYPGSQSIFDEVRYKLQDEYLDKDERNSENFITQSRGSDRAVVYERYTEQYHDLIAAINTPILVIFDSFEEIQYRASFAELQNLFNFIGEVSTFIPRLRPVFVGRSEINYPELKFEKLTIEAFDRSSGIAFLQSEGIADESLAAAIFKKLGGNPLTLQMIADLVRKENINSITALDAIANEVDQTLIQEQLVKRNLEHIHNSNVAKIAIPGILVRKINTEVIQYILAEPCGLKGMNETDAGELLETLRNETFLITETGSAISFRQDLRIALSGLIMKRPEYNGKAIHDRAIEFYRGKKEPDCKAEYLYHLLMRGDDMTGLENIYDDSVRPYIENSLAELSNDAYLFLSSLMGITASADKVKDASLKQWEEYQKTEIIDTLKKGDENSLQKISKNLESRTERSLNSNLSYYEAKVYLKLGNFKKATIIIEKALGETPAADDKQNLDLILLKSEVAEYQLDFSAAYNTIADSTLLQANLDHLLKNDFEDVEFIINGLLTWTRLARRDGEKQFQYVASIIYKIIEPFEDYIYSALKMTELVHLSAYLPFPYKTYVERSYGQLRDISFKAVYAEIDKAFLPKGDFINRYKALKDQIKNKSDLEKFLESNYNLNLKDICEPGVLEINLIDVVKFVEIAGQSREVFNPPKAQPSKPEDLDTGIKKQIIIRSSIKRK